MVFSPDSKPLFKVTGEGCEGTVGAILEQGLTLCAEQLQANEGTSEDWINHLSSHEVPMHLEKDKQVTR